jgi:DNA-binding Xre family transcriptional regulator
MNLQKILQDNNVTKAQLSRDMKVTWATVNNWCKNPNKLPIDKLQEICSCIGVEFKNVI